MYNDSRTMASCTDAVKNVYVHYLTGSDAVSACTHAVEYVYVHYFTGSRGSRTEAPYRCAQGEGKHCVQVRTG